MTVIAVYGTLRYGGRANHLMLGCEYLGVDAVSGRMYNLGSYPGVKLTDEREGHTVVVDLYKLPEEERVAKHILANLDRYEGYYEDDPSQSLYTRKKTLTLEGALDVLVYEYNHEVDHLDREIKTGDWLNDADN